MSHTPELSLIVSLYNQQAWVPVILESIAQQQIQRRFEVIICDDGSTDGSFECIRAFAAAHMLDVRCVWQPNLGFRLSRSRNNAMRMAQGELWVFVDADNWLSPEFLSSHCQAHAGATAGNGHGALVCGLRYTIDLGLSPAVPAQFSDLLGQLKRRRHREHDLQRQWIKSTRPWMACLGGNFSVPADKTLYFDERFESWGSEDRDFAYRAFAKGLQPRLLSDPNAIHFTAEDAHWTRMTHDQVVSLLKNKKILAEKYPDGQMDTSLTLVRYCHLDAETNRWSIGAFRHSKSISDIFEEFENWNKHEGAQS